MKNKLMLLIVIIIVVFILLFTKVQINTPIETINVMNDYIGIIDSKVIIDNAVKIEVYNNYILIHTDDDIIMTSSAYTIFDSIAG